MSAYRRSVSLLLAGLLALNAVPFTSAGDKAGLPAALQKDAPENVKDLRAIEQQVEKVVTQVTPAVVGVRIGAGQGSGVIVSEDGYVLTAGHVSGKPGRDAVIVMPDGKQLKAKTLGRNGGIDSGMLKISEPGKYPYVNMGQSQDLSKGTWVIAIGHPGGFRPNRTPVVRLGRVLYLNPALIRTDCTLVGGDSGGPLFDMTGKVVGIHSRIGSSAITENIHVPLKTFRDTWDRLVAGEDFGGQLGQQALIQSAGGKIVFERKGKLGPDDPKDKKADKNYQTFRLEIKAGSTYTFDLTTKNNSKKKDQVFDPYLRIEGSNGKVIAEDDDGAGDLNSRIVYRAVRDDEITIVVTSCDPGQSGSFRLAVHEADFKEDFVTGKVDVLRVVKMPIQVAGIIVEKMARGGSPLFLSIALQDKDGKPAANREVTFIWEAGRDETRTNSEGLVRWALARDKMRRLKVDLPAETRALLALTDSQGNPSGPRFAPQNDPSRELVKSAGGQIVLEEKGKLANEDPFDRERAKSYFRVHEIKMTAGGKYTIDLESDDFDPFLRLEDADRKKLAEDDDGASFLNSRIVYSPAEDGVFRVIVTSFDGGQVGDYRLTIRRAENEPTAK